MNTVAATDARAHSTVREGIIAGALGATGVAVWFLLVDVFAATILFTPERLGMAFGQVFRVEFMASGGAAAWVGYTILHYAAFALIGIFAAAIVHRSVSEPGILAGAFLAFIVSQALIYGFIALLHETDLLEHLTWPLIAVGNIIGAVVIGWYLWRAHPGLTARIGSVLGEDRMARHTEEPR